MENLDFNSAYSYNEYELITPTKIPFKLKVICKDFESPVILEVKRGEDRQMFNTNILTNEARVAEVCFKGHFVTYLDIATEVLKLNAGEILDVRVNVQSLDDKISVLTIKYLKKYGTI